MSVQVETNIEASYYLLQDRLDVERGDKKFVMAIGVFDSLKISELTQVARMQDFGDLTMVALNSDFPRRTDTNYLNSQQDRAEMVAAVDAQIDYITFFTEKDASRMIQRLKPDVIVKGYTSKYEKLPRPEVEAAKEIDAELVILGRNAHLRLQYTAY